MGIEQLKTMKEQLVACTQGQLGNIKDVDTHELGEAIDMIKDLSEAIYYCTITESMQKAGQKEEQQPPINNINYYTTPPMMMDNRNMERNGGYMYYPGGSGQSSQGQGGGSSNTTRNYTDMIGMRDGMTHSYPDMNMRDPRQGRSAMRRRMYMQGKEQHKDTKSQLKELETYLQELSTDITEMVEDASPQERAVLRQKMTTLANKIV